MNNVIFYNGVVKIKMKNKKTKVFNSGTPALFNVICTLLTNIQTNTTKVSPCYISLIHTDVFSINDTDYDKYKDASILFSDLQIVGRTVSLDSAQNNCSCTFTSLLPKNLINTSKTNSMSSNDLCHLLLLNSSKNILAAVDFEYSTISALSSSVDDSSILPENRVDQATIEWTMTFANAQEGNKV